MHKKRLVLGLAPVIALALPLLSAGPAFADPGNTLGGGDCAGGAPAITRLVAQPGPGTAAFPQLVVSTAQAPGAPGAGDFVQGVHGAICGVGPLAP